MTLRESPYCRPQFFYKNSRKFSKWVENTVGKGEIARKNQQFLLFPVFSKDLYCRHINQGLFGTGLRKLYEALDRHPCSYFQIFKTGNNQTILGAI